LDIYDGSGNKIQTNCWDGLEPVTSAQEWPHTEKPTPAEWTVWQRALTAALHLNKHCETTLKLGDQIAHKAPVVGWYLEPNTPRLYKWDGQKWMFYIQIPRQMRGVQFGNAPQMVDTEPEWNQWHRATVHPSQQNFEITGHAAHIPTQQMQSESWEEKLLGTTYTKQWQVTTRDCFNVEWLRLAMKCRQAVAVSDGSFMKGEGAAAWTIKGKNKDRRCMGTSLAPGNASDQSAFRSKLTRLYGIFFHLKYMAEGWQEEGLQITVACDRKSVAGGPAELKKPD